MAQIPPRPVNERKRHPGDVVRVVLGMVAFLLTFALAFGGRVSRTEEYLFRAVNSVPGLLFPLIHLIAQAGALASVGVAAVVAVTVKRYRLATKIALGGTSAWLLVKLVKMLAQRDRPTYLFGNIVDRAHATGILGFPSGHAAVAATLATIISPYVSKKWRRVMWVIVWTVALARVYGGAHLPLDVLAGMSLGWVVGSVTNLVFGTPMWPVPFAAIKRKLQASRVGNAEIRTIPVDARGSTPLIISTDKKKFFGKLINNENRNADLLYRLWRYITIKGGEDGAPFASAKQIIEHEAYVYAQAADAGISVPRVVIAVPVTDRAALLVTEWVPGKTFDLYQKPPPAQLLNEVWRQVRTMQGISLAHRDLRAANIMVDNQNRPWLIDFAFSELSASQQLLAIDRAELLVSLSLKADPGMVVRSAVVVLGRDAIGETLGYLQPASLTADTRKQLKKRVGLLIEIRREIVAQTGKQEVSSVKIYRLNNQTLIWTGLGVLLVFIVLTQFRHMGEYLAALGRIGLWWMMAAIAASVLTYAVSAVAVIGSTTYRLNRWRVVMLQFATTFVDRFTPLGAGQVVITQRFLENSGLERSLAVAATSLVYAAGIVTHVALLLVTVVFFVRYPIHIHSPKGWVIFLGSAILVSGAALYAVPKVQPVFRRYVAAGLQAIHQIFAVPIKAVQLLGGSAAISLSYAVALYFSLRGFGVMLPYDKVLLVYLAGSAVASVSPVPGGLGVTEVALVAGLVTFGSPEAAAVLAVLTYRLFTYLLPTLPGVFAFRYLQKRKLLDF